jgi:hypothetical protein
MRHRVVYLGRQKELTIIDSTDAHMRKLSDTFKLSQNTSMASSKYSLRKS